MKEIAHRLDAYIQTHPFDSGDSDCETVPAQLYQAYAESHESDPADAPFSSPAITYKTEQND